MSFCNAGLVQGSGMSMFPTQYLHLISGDGTAAVIFFEFNFPFQTNGLYQIYTFMWLGEDGKYIVLYGTYKFPCYQKAAHLCKSHFFSWFIFKEFALVPRVKFPSCYSKMKCQNIFHFRALFLLFFFCFPCFVLSYLFITAYISHGCKCLFFSWLLLL